MNKIYIYMFGKSQRASALFDASVTRLTAILGLIIAPIFFYAGLALENIYGILTFALIFYGAAVEVFIPLFIEICSTSKNNE